MEYNILLRSSQTVYVLARNKKLSIRGNSWDLWSVWIRGIICLICQISLLPCMVES